MARPIDASMKKTSGGLRRFVADGFLDFRDRAIVVLRQVDDRVACLPAFVEHGCGDRGVGDHRTAEGDGRIDGHRPRGTVELGPGEREETSGAAIIFLDAGEVQIEHTSNPELRAARGVDEQPFSIGVQVAIQNGQIELGERVRHVRILPPQLRDRAPDALQRHSVLVAESLQDERLGEIPEGELSGFRIGRQECAFPKPHSQRRRIQAEVAGCLDERIRGNGSRVLSAVNVLPFLHCVDGSSSSSTMTITRAHAAAVSGKLGIIGRGGNNSAVNRTDGSGVSQFDFIRGEWPDVFDAADRAENAARPDPRTSCFYARRALELAVVWIYKQDPALTLPYQEQLSPLIHDPTFRQSVGPALFAKARLIKARDRVSDRLGRIIGDGGVTCRKPSKRPARKDRLRVRARAKVQAKRRRRLSSAKSSSEH